MPEQITTLESGENERMRGDLKTIAGRISHDLRAPLGGIVIAAEALKEDGNEAAVRAGFCDAVMQSAEDLGKLLERVSFLLRASASGRVKQRMQMADAVFAPLTRLEGRILKQGAVIVPPDDWPEVRGVSAWLETVWWNLISNALTHGGGSPRIELGWREDSVQWFWVRDNGRGVPQEKRASLFHPFHRLHETNAPQGLGLPIVQRLVELQGGVCEYEPLAEGGSCFSFALPLPQAQGSPD